ncbi:ABC transporter substrate-binding protein [Streptomyces sp. MAR4 CNX-425]|uniref:ABC transporter substrate-binding protein n=1 Tax=Streptomyces sp. MAR4 CNX-425 TaxID=3406343 RepID=UPI003B51039F
MLAVAVSVALTVSACGGGGNDDDEGDEGGGAAANAAIEKVLNPSDKKGGTLVYESADVPDSMDPGNTYYGYMWNFSRLYARSLMTYAPGPGAQAAEPVPDLATAPGESSNGGKTWTYKIKKGVKYEDGTEITTADIKYAVERSNFARDVLSLGPNYFAQYLENPDDYQGPYKDKSEEGIASIETPDDYTIVFNLNQPFQEFDYLAAMTQTAPVPRDKDNGSDYQKNIVSSGSYKFESFDLDKSATLVRNDQWDPKTDKIRKQLPDKIEVRFKVNHETIDKNIEAGKTHVMFDALGVTAQTQSQMLRDESNMLDNPTGGRLTYLAMNTQLAPLDDVNCRKAVEFAIDKDSSMRALGGEPKGEIASTVLPPDVPGHESYEDPYATEGSKGNVEKAKAALKECGKPNGFDTVLTARTERQDEIDNATAIQAALKKVGINAEIQKFPGGKYFTDFAGSRKWGQDNNAGLYMMQWGADWPSGYGFLQQIANGGALGESGNTNISYLDDPEINKLLDESIANPDKAARAKAYVEVDKKMMETAAIVPLSYFKVLHQRSDEVTNLVVSQAFSGQYDYLNLGLK